MRDRMTIRMLAAFAVATMALAACSSSGDDAVDAGPRGTNAAAGGEAAAGDAEAIDASVVEVTAVEYAFQGVPDTVPAGTELRLFNAGEEMHDLNVFFVGDESAPVEELVPPEGSHVGVIAALPGEYGLSMVVPGGGGPLRVAPVVLERPGRYMLYSTMNEGSDPDQWRDFLEQNEEAGADRGVRPPFGSGEPDFLKGMVADVIVTGEDSGVDSGVDVLDVLRSDGRFDTVHDLLVNAAPPQFEGYMTSPSWGLTFLAPTDEALAALPDGVLDSLRSDPETLTRVLDLHVVLSHLRSDEFTTTELETVLGPLDAVVEGGTIRVGDATIVAPDIAASNGIIHGIDSLLIPPGMKLADLAATATTAP